MIIGSRYEDSMKAMRNTSELKAIALLSGGLDSTLAAAIIFNLGIRVVGLHITTLFDTDRKRLEHITTAANTVGIPLITVDLSTEHLEIVKHPKHGYGAEMNPCIDCRIFMLKAATETMKEERAQFVITGEVLGQRPMSQHRNALELTAKESGLGNRLLRPLSANQLPDSLPVTEGWIQHHDLGSMWGRSRKEQVDLANRLGIHEYPQPAGGCLLCEKTYAARLRDAFSFIGKDRMTKCDFSLLKYGRHFRLSEKTKTIVGRDERENLILAELGRNYVQIEPIETTGPVTLVKGNPAANEIHLSACLAARYCDHNNQTPIPMKLVQRGEASVIVVAPFEDDDPRISHWRIE